MPCKQAGKQASNALSTFFKSAELGAAISVWNNCEVLYWHRRLVYGITVKRALSLNWLTTSSWPSWAHLWFYIALWESPCVIRRIIDRPSSTRVRGTYLWHFAKRATRWLDIRLVLERWFDESRRLYTIHEFNLKEVTRKSLFCEAVFWKDIVLWSTWRYQRMVWTVYNVWNIWIAMNLVYNCFLSTTASCWK